MDDGIDDVEIQYHPPKPNMNNVVNGPRNHLVVASGRQTTICSDYDPLWLIHAHPSMFPFGAGQCPEKVPLKDWVKSLRQ